MQKPKKPVVILLTDKIATTPLYKGLSAEYHKDFDFYTIKDDPQFADAKEAYGLTNVPTLLMWKGGADVEVYDGTLKIGHISHWLKQASKEPKTDGKDEL